ncbi:hypothetical protein E2C01_005183 [Portunus trituberculatus]|uniref:Uncharacterized protein n=1 Tax=Portunus trituberculatus TaxID=210409 RepID=A0A5B7CUV1_PORTR|nr:hypothetical protein [Portunus trituberculatus]
MWRDGANDGGLSSYINQYTVYPPVLESCAYEREGKAAVLGSGHSGHDAVDGQWTSGGQGRGEGVSLLAGQLFSLKK